MQEIKAFSKVWKCDFYRITGWFTIEDDNRTSVNTSLFRHGKTYILSEVCCFAKKYCSYLSTFSSQETKFIVLLLTFKWSKIIHIWLNRGSRVYFDLYAPDIKKGPVSILLNLIYTFEPLSSQIRLYFTPITKSGLTL